MKFRPYILINLLLSPISDGPVGVDVLLPCSQAPGSSYAVFAPLTHLTRLHNQSRRVWIAPFNFYTIQLLHWPFTPPPPFRFDPLVRRSFSTNGDRSTEKNALVFLPTRYVNFAFFFPPPRDLSRVSFFGCLSDPSYANSCR